MQIEISLPYYLQPVTKKELTVFCQIPNAAEKLQMTMNPYLMGRFSISSIKPLMVLTGTDPEYSVEDFFNAVIASLFLNIGPEGVQKRHFIKIGNIDARLQSKPHLIAQPKNGFQFYL